MYSFFPHVQQSIAQRSSQPAVTWISDAGRIELSVVTLANGISKAANLLRDQCEIGSGSSVSLALPAHWQTSVWIGAIHSVAGTISLNDEPSDLQVIADVAAVDAKHSEAGVVSLHPFGMPVQLDDPFLINLSADVRMHGDQFAPRDQAVDSDVCVRDLVGQLAWVDLDARVAELADQYGIESGSRFALSQPAATIDLALLYCAVPLMTGSSVVLLDGLDSDGVTNAMAQENCTLHITL